LIEKGLFYKGEDGKVTWDSLDKKQWGELQGTPSLQLMELSQPAQLESEVSPEVPEKKQKTKTDVVSQIDTEKPKKATAPKKEKSVHEVRPVKETKNDKSKPPQNTVAPSIYASLKVHVQRPSAVNLI